MRKSLWYLSFALALVGAVLAGREGAVRMGFHRPPPQVAQASQSAATEVALPAADAASATRLESAFSRMNYQLDSVVAGESVPPVMLRAVPADLAELEQPDQRKDIFLRMMLPLVLRVDEEIAADRSRLLALDARIRQGESLSGTDRSWLGEMCDRYEVEPGPRALSQLLTRVDIVPPSLALAQAAIETGWGTSHQARSGHNLFGHTIDRGEGVAAEMAAFPTLLAAVEAYVHNLNTHRAYASLRRARVLARHQGRFPEGVTMADALINYSELGKAYVKDVRSVIRRNGLERLDHAHLSAPPAPAPAVAPRGSARSNALSQGI